MACSRFTHNNMLHGHELLIGCQDNNYPSVNMKVSHFVDWINDEVRKYKAVDSSEESREDGRENTAFI